MIAYPAVLVRGLAEARRALAPGLPITLLSPPGAALFAGCGWWHALILEVHAERPGVPLLHILDCADAPGLAMAALRMRQARLVLSLSTPDRVAVERAAAALGATVLPQPPPAFTFAGRKDARHLALWLRGDTRSALV
jgi:hypothetical protein